LVTANSTIIAQSTFEITVPIVAGVFIVIIIIVVDLIVRPKVSGSILVLLIVTKYINERSYWSSFRSEGWLTWTFFCELLLLDLQFSLAE